VKSTLLPALLVGAALLSLGGLAEAQIFTASIPVAADSDVFNSGQTALAFDFGGTNTVNGVNFSSSLTGPTGVTFSYGTGFPAGDNNGVNPVVGMSASYISVVTNLQYNGGGTGILTLGNLSIGQAYVLQLFAGTNGLGQLGSETVTDGTKSGLLLFDGNGGTTDAFYIDETFKATSAIETITVGPPGNTGFILFSAANLQEIPEPSTYAMMLGGLAFLGFCLRRRRV
jgi:hypothetical protein